MPIQQNADIYNTFELDMIPDSAPVIVYCDQYDHGTDRLVIHLIDDGVPYVPAAGAIAIIQGTKPDGHGFTYEGTIDGSTVTADLTEQMTACYGRTRVQVVVTEGEDRTGTYVFYLQVQKSALPDDTEMSASDYALIQQLLQEAEELGTKTPYIGANGDWYVYDNTEGAFVDTGTHAEGPQGPEGPAGEDGENGVSPEVTITTITGGHTVKITDADHPTGQSFNVMDGTVPITTYSQTLAAGSTSVTFNNVTTTATSILDIGTSVPDLEYIAITRSGNSYTVTFDAQSSAVTIYLIVTEAG